jgi:hypothetical protein
VLALCLSAAASSFALAEPASARTLFVGPRGSDSGRCSKAWACKSFARAYRVARLGDIVIVRGGRYGVQVLEGRLAKLPFRAHARDVIFRPARGARVSVAALELRVPHFEIRDMSVGKYKARYDVRSPDLYSAGDLTFRRIRTHHFSLNSVQNVRVLGGRVGPNRNRATGHWPDDGIFIGAYPPDEHPPRNIVLDRLYVHDITEPDSAAHSDCVQFTAGVNVTIRRSRFRRCEHADLMIKGDQGPIAGFRIENNFLGRTISAFYSINLYETSRGCRNVLIRNNSALQNIRTDSCSGGLMTGNIQPSMSSHTCSAATVRILWNLYESGSRCAASDRVGAARYANRARFDLRIRPRSAAINRGNPRNHPLRDIQGQRRPQGRATDAGADETR